MAEKDADVENGRLAGPRPAGWASAALKGLRTSLRPQSGHGELLEAGNGSCHASMKSSISRVASMKPGASSTGGLMGPNTVFSGGAESIVSAVKSMRRASMIMQHAHGGNNAPALGAKSGSLASYFYAPHPTPGTGITISPDGDYMIRFGYGPDMRLMRTSTGSVAATLSQSVGHVRFATFSSDGEYIVAATDDCRLLVWNVPLAVSGGRAAKSLVANIDVGLEPLAYCLLSPNKQTVLSCDDDGQLELWSVKQGVMVRRFDVSFAAKRARFSPDGSHIIACSDFDIQVALCNVETGEVLHAETFDELMECRNKASYCISEDGSKVLVYVTDHCYSYNVAIFDTQTLSFQKLMVSGGSLVHAEFSEDGADFVVTGRDDKIHVYDTVTGTLVVTLAGHRSDVLYCHVTSDRRHAISGDNSGHVMLWDVDRGECILRMQAHHAPVLWCGITKDCSRAVTLDNEGHAYLWFLDAQVVFDVLRQQSDQLCCLDMVPGTQSMVVGYSDGLVKCWRSSYGAISMHWSLNKHDGKAIECVAVSPNAQLTASASQSGLIVVAQVSTGAVLAELKELSSRVTSLAFAADSSVLVSAAQDGAIVVWSTASLSTQAPLHRLRVPGDAEIKTCAVTITGSMLVAGCTNGCVYAFSLHTGALQYSLATEVPLRTVIFSTCGKLIATGAADGNVRLYDANTGALKSYFVGNASTLNTLFFQGTIVGQGVDSSLVSVCARQAVTWDMAKGSKSKVADFVADLNGLFHNSTMSNRMFVNHHGLSLFDPLLEAALYDMREYEKHPGDSFLFRDGTAHITGGVHHQPMVMFTPPSTTVHMLVGENGGARSLDFSADGHMLISGNLRGELTIFNVAHHTQLYKWTAHKRSAITCVKFTHDSSAVYSCGEDCKVILWDWRTQSQLALLTGHQAPVMSVDMSLNGTVMVSGDKDGMLIVWDAVVLVPQQIVAAHEGPVLCCSVSPDGSRVASSGTDEHIVILDSQSGQELFSLDDAMDGKGMTIKFSYDGSRIEIGGEKGSVLIWDIKNNCLLYDIKAHDGKVFDCSWSGDSRRLLSVGSDGKARLWDSAAGSELCAANFHRGFGVVEAGGFIKCDLSVDGTTMAGCTAKGQLVLWYVGAELRKGPDGSMLYEWLASMPLSKARNVYIDLLEHFPLAINTQDSRGWTVLMHAAYDSNPEITKLIIANVLPHSGMLGLTASLPCPSPSVILGSAPTALTHSPGSLIQRPAQDHSPSHTPPRAPAAKRNKVLPEQDTSQGQGQPAGLAVRKVGLSRLGGEAAARPVAESHSADSSRHGSLHSSPSGTRLPSSTGRAPSLSHRVTLHAPGDPQQAADKHIAQQGNQPRVLGPALKKSVSIPTPEVEAAPHQPCTDVAITPASLAEVAAGANVKLTHKQGAEVGHLKEDMALGPETGHIEDDLPELQDSPQGNVSLSEALHQLWLRMTGGVEAAKLHRSSTLGSVQQGSVTAQEQQEPNAVRIALNANSADCVSHILDAVLSEKVTPGSYHAITRALPEVAEKYPTMCESFLTELPLCVLGEMEIPSALAGKGVIVEAANSYTSYKEVWQQALSLEKAAAGGAMIVMEAAMVRLPYAATVGAQSILSTLVESTVPVETFGSATVKAIIDYKWKRFARRRIYTKSLVYLIYVLLFTAFAVVISDDNPFYSFMDLLSYSKGRSIVALSCVLFLFGLYYMAQEIFQLYKLGASAYFDSFWNLLDLASYGATLIIMPCVVARYGVGQGHFVPALVAIEVIMLWIKQMFFALAIDGLGTFIYMTIEIIKGMRYFLLLLLMLFISFGVAFMVLFRGPGLAAYLAPAADGPPPPDSPAVPGAAPSSPSTPTQGSADAPAVSAGSAVLFSHYGDFGGALLSAFLVIFGNEDPRNALETDWPQIATVLLCIYNFTLIVVLLNMLITLMGEVYKKVVRKEVFVFLQGRAELIIEVESTINQGEAVFQVPPYLHILRPVAKQARNDSTDSAGDRSSKVEELLAQLLAASGGPASRDPPGEDGDGDSDSDDDHGNDPEPGARSFKPAQTMRLASVKSMRNLTMARLQSAHKRGSDLGGGGGESEAVMRELATLRRLMEGMMMRMKLLEASTCRPPAAQPSTAQARPGVYSGSGMPSPLPPGMAHEDLMYDGLPGAAGHGGIQISSASGTALAGVPPRGVQFPLPDQRTLELMEQDSIMPPRRVSLGGNTHLTPLQLDTPGMFTQLQLTSPSGRAAGNGSSSRPSLAAMASTSASLQSRSRLAGYDKAASQGPPSPFSRKAPLPQPSGLRSTPEVDEGISNSGLVHQAQGSTPALPAPLPSPPPAPITISQSGFALSGQLNTGSEPLRERSSAAVPDVDISGAVATGLLHRGSASSPDTGGSSATTGSADDMRVRLEARF